MAASVACVSPAMQRSLILPILCLSSTAVVVLASLSRTGQAEQLPAQEKMQFDLPRGRKLSASYSYDQHRFESRLEDHQATEGMERHAYAHTYSSSNADRLPENREAAQDFVKCVDELKAKGERKEQVK